MWEAASFIFSVVTILGGFLLWVGRIKAIMKVMENDIDTLKTTNRLLEKNIYLQEQSINMQRERIDNMQRDHLKVDLSIEALNLNIAQNNKAIASLDATLGGVQNLLKLIFDGRLKTAL